ncbi:MAG: glycosyltransferase [Saprospiraceae bacterium]|nr:glycosyltransferase [Saprospiraceae bacterium]
MAPIDLLLVLNTVIQILIWLICFAGLVHYVPKSPESQSNQRLPPVSVIICVHNHKEKIIQLLRVLSGQHYPQFEIIISDDGSSDGLKEYIQNEFTGFKNLKYIFETKTVAGKKPALIRAIESSKYEYLLLTDADCLPVSEYWIREMTTPVIKGDQMVLGFSPYIFKTGILNLIIRFESTLNGIQYLSSALRGKVYMGVGRNLLYHKSIFNPSLLNLDIPFGDDDLFVNKIGPFVSTAVVLSPNSMVFSEPKNDWKSYFQQRRRHFAAARHYNWENRLFLGVYHFSLILFYFFLILGIFSSFGNCIILMYLIRLLVVWFIFAFSAQKLESRDMVLKFPFLEPIYLVFLLVQAPFIWIKPAKW